MNKLKTAEEVADDLSECATYCDFDCHFDYKEAEQIVKQDRANTLAVLKEAMDKLRVDHTNPFDDYGLGYVDACEECLELLQETLGDGK